MVSLNNRGISVVFVDIHSISTTNQSSYMAAYNNFIILANQESSDMVLGFVRRCLSFSFALNVNHFKNQFLIRYINGYIPYFYIMYRQT